MLSTVNDKVRYLNKRNNANERENYSKWWKEQIEHYGTSVTYFTNGYTLTSHNFLYGEDPTSSYSETADVVMLTDITNDALMLSKFGIMADCDMTAVVHISSFYDQFGCGYEPKAGDLIRLTEYGADRPGGRSAPIYEITERDDEYLPLTNTLIGHYVWYIKCKRYEYSYEPGIETGPNNKQLSDGGDYGRLAGGENPEELFQPYPDSVQNSAKCIYDYYDEDSYKLDPNPNHFIPPQPPTCSTESLTSFADVPGPYSKGELFTVADEQALLNALISADAATAQFIADNWDNMMLRTLLSTDSLGFDTFIIQTSANQDDDIYYTTNLSSIDLADAFSYTPVDVTFMAEATADSDGDGYTDAIEFIAGTNTNDPSEFPVSLFNVFNNL